MMWWVLASIVPLLLAIVILYATSALFDWQDRRERRARLRAGEDRGPE